jgi:ATP-binding cassette subfamily C protein LapB
VANSILTAIAELARLRRIELRPGWADGAQDLTREDEQALDLYCEAIGWAPASSYEENPRAHEFPLLVFHPAHGWAVAERLESDNRVRIQRHGMSSIWDDADKARLFDLVIPLPAGKQQFKDAFEVFKVAVMRRKQSILLAVIATLVVNVIALVTSLYSMQVYDRVVPRGAFSTLWVLSVGALAALAFDYILRVVRSNLLEQDAVQIDSEVSEFFFSRASEIRLDVRPPSIGTTAAQLRGLEQVRSMMSSGALFGLADLPFALVFIFVIWLLGGVIATVLAVAFPVAIITAAIFARMIRKDTERAQISGNRKNGLLVESLDAAETIKANRGQWYMLARWSSLLDELHEAELPMKRLQAKAGTIFGTMQQISYICLIAWGAVEVFENRISMGALIACSILAGRVNGPLIGQLPNLLVQWSYSRISLNMLDSIMQLPTDRPADLEVLRPNRLAAALSFRGVEFAYPGAKAGIKVPKLEIAAGERIAIIGGVGSGKSTLLKLMAGLYPPQEGQLLIDRLDMTQIADDVLRHHIGYLPQDYRLVNASLRENLLLGIPDPGDEAIMDMAQRTGLASLITSHPRGLDLQISEGGRGLSGGQRVLTGLTRLMLSQPKLLLLDEPTANLDVDTEQRVLRTIAERLAKDTTLVLVTHKLQLVNLVQRVMVVANGEIAIDGPTQEVLQRLQRPQPQPPAAPKVQVQTASPQPQPAPASPAGQEGTEA